MTDHIIFACSRPSSRNRKFPSNFADFTVGDTVIRTVDQQGGATHKIGTIVSLNSQTGKAYVAWRARPKLGSFNDTYHTYISTVSLTVVEKARVRQ